MAPGLSLAVPLLLAATACLAQPAPTEPVCGEVRTVASHDGTTTRYAFRPAAPNVSAATAITLLLLPGGSGHVDLDAGGCPRQLKGNSLVRSISLFAEQGFATALLDAPSDHHGEDGLGGFRLAAPHADDLGRVIADLRQHAPGAVWLVGTSRGSISAVNAAARLAGPSAADGVVLTSALMAGQPGAKKYWVAQSVFDLPLENIRLPVLVVGHAADACVRSPAGRMGEIAARLDHAARRQIVKVGSEVATAASLHACEGNSPHGFVGQEAEVAAGIARFVRHGNYH